jgi:hypothetical protein
MKPESRCQPVLNRWAFASGIVSPRRVRIAIGGARPTRAAEIGRVIAGTSGSGRWSFGAILMDAISAVRSQATRDPSFCETALIELCLLATFLGPILCFAIFSR